MSQFNYNDYQKVVANAQSGSTPSVKVGFFKLKNDGEEALIRINCASLDDLQFATVHTVKTSEGRWMRVSCLNPLGQYGDSCALCSASLAEGSTVSKAGKKVYVQMLVSYRDATTGSWSAATPVIWERPAGFSRELANKIRDFGSLKEHVFKVTRNGAAGDMKTTYSLDYVPVYDKPELVSSDFSAFNNFNIAKHSYWEKTAEEIDVFLQTGEFPEVTKEEKPAKPVVSGTPVFSSPEEEHQAEVALGMTTEEPVPAKEEPKAEEPAPARPTRNFSGFSF